MAVKSMVIDISFTVTGNQDYSINKINKLPSLLKAIEKMMLLNVTRVLNINYTSFLQL